MGGRARLGATNITFLIPIRQSRKREWIRLLAETAGGRTGRPKLEATKTNGVGAASRSPRSAPSPNENVSRSHWDIYPRSLTHDGGHG